MGLQITKGLKMEGIKKGDIVQITNESHDWYPCLIIVDEITSFGIQGYITIPTNDTESNGNAFIRLKKDDYEMVGTALFVMDS